MIWLKAMVNFSHGKFRDNVSGVQTNSLQYYGIIRAIKVYLKEIKKKCLHKQNNPFIPIHILPFVQQQKGTKIMYNVLSQNKDVPTGKITWN